MNTTNGNKRPALLDLDDAELEHHLLKTGGLYPTVSSTGKPLFDANGSMPLSEEERMEMISRLEQKFAEIFDVLRIDRNDPNSTDSPFRLARMWVTELFAGRVPRSKAVVERVLADRYDPRAAFCAEVAVTTRN